MLLLVTGIGALIHIYSLGYMKEMTRQVPLLRGALLFHVLDDRNRSLEQFRHDVHFLGTGWREFLFAHRPLVRTRCRGRGSQEGIHHESGRRLRIHAWNSDGVDRNWNRCVSRDGRTAWAASPVIPGYVTITALLVFCGAVGKIGAVPAARLVAGRDGRAHADLRVDPRRDHGGRRRLHAGARRFSHPDLATGALDHRVDRNHHRRHGRRSSPRSKTTSNESSPTPPCPSSATW